MDYIPLGDTGVQIPQIGLGTYNYAGGDGPLQRGVALGATLIDTAESYSTEGAVGSAIKDIRDQVLIATKVSPSNFRRGDVIKAADRSLKRLGTDHIDLYQLHWANSHIPIGETMSAMDRLVEDGKVRFIGVSNFSVAEMEEAQAATSNRIVSNQVRYSLIEREIERELLPYCQENDVTFMAYSPLAKDLGRLKADLGRGVLNQVAESAGKTQAQVALNWCISRQNVMAIPKSDSVERIEENCGASGWGLTPEQMPLLGGTG